MQREVDTTRERMERLQSVGCADYLHMALLDRAERAEAERDAAFAAGQESMRERAADACRVSRQDQAEGCWRSEGMEMSRVLRDAIRALPIKDKPDDR